MSGIDYCISLLDGAPKTMTDKLQRVMNAAACITANTRKFDHGPTQLRRDILYWLDVADRITFRLCVNSRGLRVFVLSFVRPPTRETTVFNISFMRLFVTEAS